MDNPNVVQVGESDVAFDKLFRTALGGFNKDDVINYLERMARNRKKDAERYAAHIRKLEEELEALKAGGADEEVRTDKPESASRVSLLESENAALRSEIEVLRLQAAEACPCMAGEDCGAVQMQQMQEMRELPASDGDVQDEPLPAQEADTDFAAEQAPAEPASAPLLDALREENASLTMCYTELSRKCAVLEEKLRANEVEKLRLREIEEAAHRSAEQIEETARQNAAQIEKDARSRAEASVQSLNDRVAHMQELLAGFSTGIDETTRAIYAELSECGLRYSALRRANDDLRAELAALSRD